MTSAEAFIGREEETEISVRDPEVSRRHARISWQGEDYVIEDLGSTNGTFLNGALLTSPQLLRSGDTIGMGQTLLVFQTEANAVTAQAPVPQDYPATPPPSPAATPAGQKSRNSQCLLWGCGCLILLGLFSIIVVGVAIILFGQEIQLILDTLGFTI
jgi:predicted component of type VI protein secretion system